MDIDIKTENDTNVLYLLTESQVQRLREMYQNVSKFASLFMTDDISFLNVAYGRT
jgi:hypothetical protein